MRVLSTLAQGRGGIPINPSIVSQIVAAAECRAEFQPILDNFDYYSAMKDSLLLAVTLQAKQEKPQTPFFQQTLGRLFYRC